MMMYSPQLIVCDTTKGMYRISVVAASCFSICQSFVPITEQVQAEIVTERNRKYMQFVN